MENRIFCVMNLLLQGVIYSLVGIALSTDCPDTWTAFKGSCYLFGTETPLKFVEAEHFCRQHGGHLVHVNDGLEDAFLKHYIHSFRPANYWLGMTDERIEGVWVWYDTNTSPTYLGWWPGQPDDQSGEDCAEFSRGNNYTWNDVPCDRLLEPICEIRKSVTEVIG